MGSDCDPDHGLYFYSEEEKSVVNGHCNHLALQLLYVLRNAKTDFLRCSGYLNFTKDHM